MENQLLELKPAVVGMEKATKEFCLFCAVLLGITGMLKLSSVLEGDPLFQHPDPVFLIRQDIVIAVTGALEMLAVFMLILYRRRPWIPVIPLFLGASFLLYRLGALISDVQQPCPCLGRAVDLLFAKFGWPWHYRDDLLCSTAIFMILGSCFLIIMNSSMHRATAKDQALRTAFVGGQGHE